jgi:SAM-dependent methyltransferase
MSWEKWLKEKRYTLFKTAIIQEQYIQCIIDNIPENGSVLDCGIGTGVTLELLRDSLYDAWGIDIEPLAIKLATERFPHLKGKVKVGDIFDENSYDKHYDAIIHQGVAEHFTDEKMIELFTLQKEYCDKIIFDVPNSLRENQEDEGDYTRFESPEFWEDILDRSGLTFERYGRNLDKQNNLICDDLKRYDSPLMKSLGRTSIFVCKKK